MQSKKNIEKSFIKLTTLEIKELKNLIEDINLLIKANTISEVGLRTLLNAHRTLDKFKESYILRLITIFKQNHMLS
tara:strand:+ start:24776 stop:25003 length:228 start_codon:yes stop_codon:yes gene_type:complete